MIINDGDGAEQLSWLKYCDVLLLGMCSRNRYIMNSCAILEICLVILLVRITLLGSADPINSAEK
jgi:hypothetical protein